MRTASPRRDVISIGVRSALTFSINGKRFLRASLAVTAMVLWYHKWYDSRATKELDLRAQQRHLTAWGAFTRDAMRCPRRCFFESHTRARSSIAGIAFNGGRPRRSQRLSQLYPRVCRQVDTL